jgi:hypothetical protein
MWQAKYAMAYFSPCGRNGDSDDRRLKSKSDNAGKSSQYRRDQVRPFAAKKLAPSALLMLPSSVDR